MLVLPLNTIPRSVTLRRLRVRFRLLSHPRLMSQSTYGDHPDWFRSTLSYDERGAALFGSSSSSSSSGSDYETEEALSQSTTDDGCVENVEGTTVPPHPVPRHARAQSPVTVRSGSPHRPSLGDRAPWLGRPPWLKRSRASASPTIYCEQPPSKA